MSCIVLTSVADAVRAAYSAICHSPARYILRREPKKSGSVKPAGDPIVNRAPFNPRPVDVDGISVYFSNKVNPAIVAAGGKKGKAHYYVIRVKVSVVKALGLTVKSTPLSGGIPGHAVILELKYGQDEAKIKEWGAKIALTVALRDIFDGETEKWLG